MHTCMILVSDVCMIHECMIHDSRPWCWCMQECMMHVSMIYLWCGWNFVTNRRTDKAILCMVYVCCMYPRSLTLMHVWMMHVSMILDPDSCVYDTYIYDPWPWCGAALMLHACIYDAYINDPWLWCMCVWCTYVCCMCLWSSILDPDAFMYEACIYDHWSSCMCFWCMYDAAEILWRTNGRTNKAILGVGCMYSGGMHPGYMYPSCPYP